VSDCTIGLIRLAWRVRIAGLVISTALFALAVSVIPIASFRAHSRVIALRGTDLPAALRPHLPMVRAEAGYSLWLKPGLLGDSELWMFTLNVTGPRGTPVSPIDVDELRPTISERLRSDAKTGATNQPGRLGDVEATMRVADAVLSARSSLRLGHSGHVGWYMARMIGFVGMVLFGLGILFRLAKGMRYRRGFRALEHGRCPACGYPLVRSAKRAERCPECGTEFDSWRTDAERSLR